jgi:phospholipase/carboxylesterase
VTDDAGVAARIIDDPRRTDLSVIWLHGIGQGPGHVWAVARRLGLPEAGVRGVFPRAPGTVVSAVTGRAASTWFTQTLSKEMRVDLSSLADSDRWVRALIDAEVGRFGARRVALAGFSQGAVMALYTGLRYRVALAGLALYAAFPPQNLDLLDSASPATARVPVWMGHGRRDWVVPYWTGDGLRRQLADRGHPVSWHRYPGGHETFGGVAAELTGFFRDCAGSSGAPDGPGTPDRSGASGGSGTAGGSGAPDGPGTPGCPGAPGASGGGAG